MYACVSSQMHASQHLWRPKRVLGLLELDFQLVVSSVIQVLGTDLWFSPREVSAHDLCTIPLTPWEVDHWYGKKSTKSHCHLSDLMTSSKDIDIPHSSQ